MSEHRVELIRQALRAGLGATLVEVSDDSAQHAGHAGARSGKGHFRVRVVAECFRGRPALERHRAVYAALGPLLDSDIHALSIDARAPGE